LGGSLIDLPHLEGERDRQHVADSKLADEGEQQLQKPLSVLDRDNRLFSGPDFHGRGPQRCLGAVLGPDGQGQLGRLPARGPMAGRMPEAAGRGEGETEDDGKLTWAVDREPSHRRRPAV